MNISAVLIIKRGETTPLIKCLDSVRPYAAEIIGVVDPRNPDSTDEVLASSGASQVDFQWTGDYSEARNAGLAAASGDFILTIDTDEYITHFNFPGDNVNSDLHVMHDVYRILRTNDYNVSDMAMQNKERINRIFKNGIFHYEGRVHEQLVRNDGKPYSSADADIVMHHTGYDDPGSMLEKCHSRREDLMIMLAGNQDDPYILFQIGRTYYVEKDYKNAILYFEKALSTEPDSCLEYVEQLIETYGYSLLAAKEYSKAMSLFSVYHKFSRYADFIFLCALIYMDNARFDDAISEFLKATTYTTCNVEGVNSYLAYFNCGVIKECLGQKHEAISFYEKCGSYRPAADGIRRCSS